MNQRRSRLNSRIRKVAIVESLEDRALLSTVAFNPPDLKPLIALAHEGENTAAATINKMISSLQSQLLSGPLADLNASTVDGNGFVAEVQSLAASYEANADTQLSPAFPNVDQLIKLQGQRIVADVISLNQQSTVGLITSAQLATEAEAAINALTGGPLYALETPTSAYVTTTQDFEANLGTLTATLSTGTTPSLTIQQVSTTLTAEAEAYRNDLHSALQVTHPNISSQVDEAVDTLESTVSTIAQSGTADAQAQVTNAINVFDTAIFDTTGLFGPSGAVAQAVATYGYLPHNLTVKQAATAISSVSGTASAGATATLTATLTTSDPTGLSGKTIVFTLDGAFAGTAVTNSSGVATVTGVPTTDLVGTGTDSIVASFAGDIGYKPSNGTGDLVVSQTATTLSDAAGTASFGGTATLTATLTSNVTGLGIAGETVSFTLSGTSVGTVATDSNGVATLTGVATSAPVGTVTGAVVASFAGDTSYGAAADATGDLVVSQAATSLTSVAGTASYGGSATLTATLTSTVTGLPIAGETVSFSLSGGTAVTGVTNSSGVATATAPTTAVVGTVTGAVVATFAGDTNYASSTGTGDLVVSQAATSLTSVAGTASFGGTATMTATLMSTVTNQPIPNEAVSFTLSGGTTITEQTNSSGVATATTSTSAGVGTVTGAVVATFGGDANYATSTGTGDLVVSQAATSLTSVAGTASYGGNATMTATLMSTVTGQPISGETVSFVLSGGTAVTGVTNSSGVATATAPTSAPVGTVTGAVVATFAGDTNYLTSTGTGDLVVSPAATSLTLVSGTAPVGGPATLVATLMSTVTNQPLANQTVSFTLDGVTPTVSTAVTNASGVATLTGVPTSDSEGTHTGAVVANYTATTDYNTSTGTGDLVVSAT